MFSVCAFLADRLTVEARLACENVGVNPDIIRRDLFQKIQYQAREIQN